MVRTARPTRLVAVPATLALAAVLAACGGGSDEAASDDPVVIEIEFADGEVTPVAEEVSASPGQPIDLEVTADGPGSLHIHSDPEQEFEFDEGTETFKIQIDRPGTVEVESHELDTVIVELQIQ